MLPKYLPPPLMEMFTKAVIQKLDDELEAGAAVAFVHDTIADFEKQGLEPLQALEKAYKTICKPQAGG